MSDEDVMIAAKAAPRLALALFHDSLVSGLAARTRGRGRGARRRPAGRTPADRSRVPAVAARVPGFGPTADWNRLGIYRMLDGAPAGELHPGVERLLAEPQHLHLLETLEAYLDLAGNVVARSRVLRLHRTSLYYRLQRVEKLAETDLKDGGERLSLKLARLAGRYR